MCLIVCLIKYRQYTDGTSWFLFTYIEGSIKKSKKNSVCASKIISMHNYTTIQFKNHFRVQNATNVAINHLNRANGNKDITCLRASCI